MKLEVYSEKNIYKNIFILLNLFTNLKKYIILLIASYYILINNCSTLL